MPDDHITAVANQFVIYEIDLNDKENFLASANIFDVAVRNNLWYAPLSVPIQASICPHLAPICTPTQNTAALVRTLICPHLAPICAVRNSVW